MASDPDRPKQSQSPSMAVEASASLSSCLGLVKAVSPRWAGSGAAPFPPRKTQAQLLHESAWGQTPGLLNKKPYPLVPSGVPHTQRGLLCLPSSPSGDSPTAVLRLRVGQDGWRWHHGQVKEARCLPRPHL